MVRRWALAVAGLVLGVLSAAAGATLLAAAGLALVPVLAWPRGRRAVLCRVHAAAQVLVGAERRRLTVFLAPLPAPGMSRNISGRRAMRYLAMRCGAGVLAAAVLLALAGWLAAAISMLLSWTAGTPWPVLREGDRVVTTNLIMYILGPAAILLYLNLTGIAAVAELERRLAVRILGPTRAELLRRISELSASRAGVVEAVDQERRRIERDLHDGVQQRVVALGMLLGRARRKGDFDLLAQAHEESRQVLSDLRDVAWRVYPAALDALGLREALAAVAERSQVPVTISYGAGGRLPTRVETAAYFVVCEAVTNAAKHAGASRILVDIIVDGATGTDGEARAAGAVVRIRVHDDGAGGADAAGGGLSGLSRRVAALDGRFWVNSPPGGPTVVGVELPCAL